ncbi:ABC-three component system protein [Kribbella sp. CA-245084]|uniref:ABC-three component system protein n=1 Tax=Kribbella sp. CA-245084 TaxID=3239940 RepID=UPI003D8C840C
MDGAPLLIEIESLDDVTFPQSSGPLELLQLKHHQGERPVDLTTASVDVWSSLRVWCTRLSDGDLTDDAYLFLITTAGCADDSAPALLGVSDRDVEKAETLLFSYAQASEAKTTRLARVAFCGLSRAQRLNLLDRVRVIADAPEIDALDDRLNQILRFARPSKVNYVRERMVEWWYARSAQHLSKKTPGPINSAEIDLKIEALSDALSSDNLPIDVPEPLEDELGVVGGNMFARQLSLLPVSSARVLQAAKDYMQAFTQRSRWLGSELLTVGDLAEYESELVAEWRRRFNVMSDELGPTAAEEEMRREAKLLYRWIELEAHFPIRPRCTAAFVTRGSFHILSDQMRVGWHPAFMSILSDAIEESTA